MSGVIVCGIPKNEQGQYYCPYCDYKSDDIENFAIAMCWDCVFRNDIEETKEETGIMSNLDERYNQGEEITDYRKIKPGDHLLVYREVDVRSVGGTWGTEQLFTTKDGRDIRMGGTGLDGKPYPAFKVRKIAKPGPDNWPPVAGQVWRDESGAEYFVLQQPGDGVKIYTVDDKWISASELYDKPGVKLVYKAGQ